MSCLHVSELTGKELCQFTYYAVYNCHLLILNLHFFFWKQKRWDTLVENLQSVGVIMIRLESPLFFLVNMNLGVLIMTVLVILNSSVLIQDWFFTRSWIHIFLLEELFLKYSGFCKLILWILNFVGWEIHKSNPIFHVLYIHNFRRVSRLNELRPFSSLVAAHGISFQ